MIQRFVTLALKVPMMVTIFAVGIVIAGLLAYKNLPIEAYPNPVPPLVEVITQPVGWSAEETERYVTIPLEVGLAGMRGLDHIRSQSLFELSDVKFYFTWGTDYYKAQQEVINRLQFVTLPNGLTAQLSPWNAIGEVFRYVLRGRGYSLQDFKTAEDWILERQWKQVPGVIDVTSFGGETKQYHVEVDPYRLRGRAISLSQLTSAITNANQNTGGNRMVIGEQSFDVRSLGLIKSPADIDETVITEQKGTPIRVRDVADVVIGPAPRLGMVGYNREPDVVQGIVLMRYGAETAKTLDGIYKRIDYIRKYHILPPGMDIEPYYDRNNLVKVTTHTVMENLLMGMALVIVVLLLFLGNTRAAIITALNIPIALLIAFCGMVLTGTPANLISLGAVDFGIVVDSTVIMMENIFRHLGHDGHGSVQERVISAASEVGGPMMFSTLIIAVAFLPLFTLYGVSGVIFSPMAHTYAFAIGGAILLAITLTPVLTAKFMPAEVEEKENVLMRVLHRVYNPMFDVALRWPKVSSALGAVPVFLCIALFPLLGGEFMPKLEEGNFWIRATLPMSISLDQSSKYVGRMRNILLAHPEVESVVSQLGRPDDGTDVTGFYNIEMFAPLKPYDKWPRGLTKEKLTDQLSKQLEEAFPGVFFAFSQYISDNVEEALSGVKGENSVKVIGPDLRVNEKIADGIIGVMSEVPGVKDLGLVHSLGQPNIVIVPDRRISARYGLNTGDVDAVVQAAVGGQAITQVFEGEKRFDLTVRWLGPYRRSIEDIRQITVASPDGNQIPLGQLASISEEEGPSTIFREDGSRYVPVKFSVRGRDLQGTIAEAKSKIEKMIKLPYDTHLEWAGQINELKETQSRLMIIVPLSLLVITLLTYSSVRNWLVAAVVLIGIPVACTGGVLALLITGTPFSISAAMGFISVFGIAVQDALLMVMYFQQLHRQGLSAEVAARQAAEKRFRPVLMTTLVALFGLLPAALSHAIGAQTQRPLALVVIGGALQLAILTRLMQPPLLVLVYRWIDRHKEPHPAS